MSEMIVKFHQDERGITRSWDEVGELVRCKDCRNMGEDECPMRHVEMIEWEEDGYIEVDDIVHDYTEPYGYCDKGERNE